MFYHNQHVVEKGWYQNLTHRENKSLIDYIVYKLGTGFFKPSAIKVLIPPCLRNF